MLTVKGVPMFYLPVLYYPTKKDGPRHRLPDPDLRLVDAARPVASQRVLLGDQPQPGRDVPARLVLEDRARASAASTATTSAPADGNIRALLSTISTRRPTCSRTAASTHVAGATQLRDPRQRQPAAARSTCARAPTSTTSRASRTSQTFNTNIYDASRNQRTFGGNVVGAWGTYSLNATFDHTEYFYDPTDSVLSGSWPRVVVHAQRAAAVRRLAGRTSRRAPSSRSSLRRQPLDRPRRRKSITTTATPA